MCYVLLVIQLLSMNGFFPVCYEFFPVCHGHRAVLLVIGGVTCRLPVYRRIFSVYYGFFPVIYSWAFVHQSSCGGETPLAIMMVVDWWWSLV